MLFGDGSRTDSAAFAKGRLSPCARRRRLTTISNPPPDYFLVPGNIADVDDHEPLGLAQAALGAAGVDVLHELRHLRLHRRRSGLGHLLLARGAAAALDHHARLAVAGL